MKDDQGLGIHIAGGRGCKKGDIGIFVAAVTEGGAAFRSVKRHISCRLYLSFQSVLANMFVASIENRYDSCIGYQL